MRVLGFFVICSKLSAIHGYKLRERDISFRFVSYAHFIIYKGEPNKQNLYMKERESRLALNLYIEEKFLSDI